MGLRRVHCFQGNISASHQNRSLENKPLCSRSVDIWDTSGPEGQSNKHTEHKHNLVASPLDVRSPLLLGGAPRGAGGGAPKKTRRFRSVFRRFRLPGAAFGPGAARSRSGMRNCVGLTPEGVRRPILLIPATSGWRFMRMSAACARRRQSRTIELRSHGKFSCCRSC